MLHLLNVVGQLAEQECVDSLHLTYHLPYNVACNSECHFCQTVVNGAGRVDVTLCLAAALQGGYLMPHGTIGSSQEIVHK